MDFIQTNNGFCNEEFRFGFAQPTFDCEKLPQVTARDEIKHKIAIIGLEQY